MNRALARPASRGNSDQGIALGSDGILYFSIQEGPCNRSVDPHRHFSVWESRGKASVFPNFRFRNPREEVRFSCFHILRVPGIVSGRLLTQSPPSNSNHTQSSTVSASGCNIRFAIGYRKRAKTLPAVHGAERVQRALRSVGVDIAHPSGVFFSFAPANPHSTLSHV